MKLLKIFAFGCMTALISVGAGQTAELQAKAKTADQLKACSKYGAGFYYVPATGSCIKIGGWVRTEGGSSSHGTVNWNALGGSVNSRTTSDTAMGARGAITADVRQETGYGTVRAYLSVGNRP
jgi:FAD/FMN-containing dehydrogenase